MSGFVLCTSPRSYSDLGQRSHTFEVRAVDQDGNAEPTPESYTWTVDTAAHQTTLDASGLSDTITASRDPT